MLINNQFPLEFNPLITVLTPTYNRAARLTELWNSLCLQTSKQFIWFVVDVGSTDNTQETVNLFAEQSEFPIIYKKKENGGKHTALNVGISEIKTPLTFIVDSDDTLTSDAIETIANHYEVYKNDACVCGFSYLRTFPNGEVNGKVFPYDMWKESYITARVNSGDTLSDKAEVYKTECLKEFPFPEFEGEKFLGEDIVWVRMGRKYKTVHINKAIYIGEYLRGGLTKNRRRHNFTSLNGCTARAKEFLNKDICLKQRVKATLQYLIYGRSARISYKKLYSEAPNISMCLILTLPAWIIRMVWEIKFSS